MLDVIGRFLSFAFYLLLFFLIPLGILWETTGLVVGVVLFGLFLFFLKFQAIERTLKRLGAEPVSRSEAPVVYTILKEHCRRLELPVPAVYMIRVEAVNTAVIGFSQEKSCLILTKGLLDSFSREELSSIIARQLLSVWHRDTLGATWLSRFLAFLDRLSRLGPKEKSRSLYSQDSFGLFLKRMIFYPLALFPTYVLAQGRPASDLDRESVAVSRLNLALSEALRKMEALRERKPLYVRFSLRHLFLVAPESVDPIVGILFKTTLLKDRIRSLVQPLSFESPR